MTAILIPFFVVLIGESLALGVAPTGHVTLKKVDVKVTDNPYIGSWSCEILSAGDAGSCKLPVKKDLPSTLMVKFNLTFQGALVKESETEFCEAFKDPTYFKDIFDAGTPKNKFPKNCPVKANDEYAISEYTFPQHKLLPGLPDGQTVIQIVIYEDGKDPYLSAYIEAEVTQQMPKLSGR